MKKLLLTRLLFIGTASVVVTTGAFRVVSAYRSGSGFVPFLNERAFNGNRVLFPGEDSVQSQNGDNQNDDASFMEKDNTADSSANFSNDNSSSYLYENNKTVGTDAGGVTMFADNGGAADGQAYGEGRGAGSVIEYTDDRSSADMIIGSGMSSDGGSSSGTGSGTGSAGNAAESGYASAGSGNPGSGSGGSGGAGGGGGTAGGGAGGGSAADPGNNGGAVTPDAPNGGGGNSGSGSTPASTAKEPTPSKTESDLPYGGITFKPGITYGPYMTVMIGQPSQSSMNILYRGQTIDRRTIFASLDAYVEDYDFNATDPSLITRTFYWTEADYGKFFRVDAISFDDGESWITDFPVTIPIDLEANKMQIKVSYRFNDKDAWIEEIVGKSTDGYNKYDPASYRVMVLSKRINEENTTISTSDIVNPNQYGDSPNEKEFNLLGSNGIEPLYKYSEHMFDPSVGSIRDERIKDMFQGWTENGVQVSWLYEPTNGRHILEPMEFVPIDDAYDIRLYINWMSKYKRYDFISNDEMKRRAELGIDASGYDTLCYLQTLRNYTMPSKGLFARFKAWLGFENGDTVLEVPKYVQSIDIEEEAELETDYLDIPSTVMYINTAGTGLKVHKGYRVADDNPYFASENGLLLSKDKTEVIAIPDEMTEIIIGETINKVNIPTINNISQVTIDMGDSMTYPSFTGRPLTNCRFVIDINDFENFVYDNIDSLFAEGTGNCLISPDEPDVIYTLQGAVLIDSNMSIYRVLDIGATSVRLPDGLKVVTSFAFAGAKTIKQIIMPSNGDVVEFEQGSLMFSYIDTILCNTKEQYDSVKACIEETGVDDPDNVKIILTDDSKEGYTYTVDTDESGNQYVTVVSAPGNIRDFDGYIYDETGNKLTVNAIGDGAFANCTELMWATLTKAGDSIGYRAFAGCSALQGVFIDARDSITIGNKAFDGCNSLRMVVSNAMHATMNGGYDPAIIDKYSNSVLQNNYFFALPDAEGYGSNCNRLENLGNLTNVKEYQLIKLDNSSSLADCRMLYLKFDNNGDKYVAMRSGLTMPDETVLNEDIMAFYPYALADTVSQSGGSYTVNWENLDTLEVINYDAFINADIGGDVIIHENNHNGKLMIGPYAFQSTNITNVKIDTTLIDTIQSSSIGTGAFTDCGELESVEFKEFYTDASITAGTFTGCDKLKSIKFDYNLPQLVINGNTPFKFNYDSPEESSDDLEIIVPYTREQDPEFFEEYVNIAAESWRFAFIGCSGYGSSHYLQLRGDVDYDLRDPDTWDAADDLTINAEIERRVLEGENRIRKLLGAEPKDEPYNLYHFKTDYWGEMVYLTGVPKHEPYIMLYGNWIGLPDGWSLDYINKDAFAVNDSLISIDIPSSIIGIEPGAFNVKELGSDKLTVYLSDNRVPALNLGTNEYPMDEGDPFEFGLSDDKLNFVTGSTESAEAYVNAWSFPLAGYKDLDAMRQAIGKQLGYIVEPELPEYGDYGDLFSADTKVTSDAVFYNGALTQHAANTYETGSVASAVAGIDTDNAAESPANELDGFDGISLHEGAWIIPDNDNNAGGDDSDDAVNKPGNDSTDAGNPGTGSDGTKDDVSDGNEDNGDNSESGSGNGESGEISGGSTGSGDSGTGDVSGSTDGGDDSGDISNPDTGDIKGEDGLTDKERAEVDAIIAEKILPCENRLRVMFGLDEVESVTVFEPTVYEPTEDKKPDTKEEVKEETEIKDSETETGTEEPGTSKDTESGTEESGVSKDTEAGTETGTGSESGEDAGSSDKDGETDVSESDKSDGTGDTGSSESDGSKSDVSNAGDKSDNADDIGSSDPAGSGKDDTDSENKSDAEDKNSSVSDGKPGIGQDVSEGSDSSEPAAADNADDSSSDTTEDKSGSLETGIYALAETFTEKLKAVCELLRIA